MNYASHIEPETQSEKEFIDRLIEVRDFGRNETELEAYEIIELMQTIAVAMQRESGVVTVEEPQPCPTCGNPIFDITLRGLGEQPVVEECGHTIPFSELEDEMFLDR